jgi:TrkA domain protein
VHVAEVTETQLPGVGIRYEFTTEEGTQLGVLCHHGGRREIFVYDDRDPDVARSVVRLSSGDSRTLTELLGATQISEELGAMQQRIEGVTLDWIDVSAGSSLAGRTIGEGELRTRTGVSLVAVLRDGDTEPAPGPDFVLEAGDVAVAVGTPEGLEQLRQILRK